MALQLQQLLIDGGYEAELSSGDLRAAGRRDIQGYSIRFLPKHAVHIADTRSHGITVVHDDRGFDAPQAFAAVEDAFNYIHQTYDLPDDD